MISPTKFKEEFSRCSIDYSARHNLLPNYLALNRMAHPGINDDCEDTCQTVYRNFSVIEIFIVTVFKI
jgi:hypothetical protein